MAYRLRYTFNVDWVGPGAGPMEALVNPNPGGPNLPGGGSTGQTKGFCQTGAGQISQTFVAGDITNLTTAAAADMVTQLTAAIATIQAWSTGNP